MRSVRHLVLALVVALAGCGDDPVDPVPVHSARVGVHVAFASRDVAGGTVGGDRWVYAEADNAYNVFIAITRDELGHDPARIELDHLTVELGSGSTGVDSLGDIYDGRASIAFQMQGTDTSVPVATLDVTPTTPAGPVGVATAFDSSAVVGNDWSSLLDGIFRVVITGPARGDFASANASVDLLASFTFSSYE